MVSRIRRAKSSVKQLVIPGMFFEDMGITYLGPVDGHNIESMIRVINEAKRVKGAVIIENKEFEEPAKQRKFAGRPQPQGRKAPQAWMACKLF